MVSLGLLPVDGEMRERYLLGSLRLARALALAHCDWRLLVSFVVWLIEKVSMITENAVRLLDGGRWVKRRPMEEMVAKRAPCRGVFFRSLSLYQSLRLG